MNYDNKPIKIGLTIALAVFVYNWVWLFFFGDIGFVLPFGRALSWDFQLMRFFEVFTVVTLASWAVFSVTKGTLLRIMLVSGLVLAFELPPLTLPAQDVIRGLFYLIAISIAVNIFGKTRFKEGELSSSGVWKNAND